MMYIKLLEKLVQVGKREVGITKDTNRADIGRAMDETLAKIARAVGMLNDRVDVAPNAWIGIELFLEPGLEVLVAWNGEDVARHLSELTPDRAARIGRRARERISTRRSSPPTSMSTG